MPTRKRQNKCDTAAIKLYNAAVKASKDAAKSNKSAKWKTAGHGACHQSGSGIMGSDFNRFLRTIGCGYGESSEKKLDDNKCYIFCNNMKQHIKKKQPNKELTPVPSTTQATSEGKEEKDEWKESQQEICPIAP